MSTPIRADRDVGPYVNALFGIISKPKKLSRLSHNEAPPQSVKSSLDWIAGVYPGIYFIQILLFRLRRNGKPRLSSFIGFYVTHYII